MGGLACKTKIVLDGGTVQDTAQGLCYVIQETPEDALTYDQWIDIVKHVNAAEEAMFKAQRSFLEARGFKGPWPKSMS